MPWLYVRREIAKRWGIPPPLVDHYPHREVQIELRLMSIEAEASRKRQGYAAAQAGGTDG